MPRACGASGPLRPLDSIADVSGKSSLRAPAKQSVAPRAENGLLRRGACHRGRSRATRWLLAMTAQFKHAYRPRGAVRARALEIRSPFANKGAGNAGCPMHPQPRARFSELSMRTSIHSGGTGNIRHSPRSGFNSLWRALPGDRLCPRHSLDDRASLPGWARATPSKLDTSIGVSGPHALAVRISAARLARRHRSRICFALRLLVTRTTPSRPPHPTTNVRDDREPPLLWGGVAGANHTFLKNGSCLFLQGGTGRPKSA